MKQHQPLRTPNGWKEQEVSLVIQIDRLLDDVYKMLGNTEKKLKELEERVANLEE